MMDDYVEPGKSYRALLRERQGQGFSEIEVTEILQQVLLKLVPMHQQGLVHGGISLDTIVQEQNTLQAVLVANPDNPAASHHLNHQSAAEEKIAAQDIYALGVTMIALLIGQDQQDFHDREITENLQDRCVIGSHLAAVLARSIAAPDGYANAMEMLAALSHQHHITPFSPTRVQSTVQQPLPTDEEPAANTSSSPEETSPPEEPPVASGDVDESYARFSIFNPDTAPWRWAMISAVLTSLIAVVGFALSKYQPAKVAKPNPNPTVSTPSVLSAIPTNSPNAAIPNAASSYIRKQQENTQERNSVFPSTDIGKGWQTSPAVRQANRIPTKPQTVPQVSPLEVVQNYYESINRRNYKAGWNKLSTKMKNADKVHPEGFRSFTDWWEKIDNVEVAEADLASVATETAVVNTRLKYQMKSGGSSSEKLQFFLVRNKRTGKWMIDNVQRR
jgi:serine/threonine-protein kinase